MDDFERGFDELEEDELATDESLLADEDEDTALDDEDAENPLLNGFHDPEDLGEEPEL